MSESDIDVLIVGAGPAGLFCANELIRHGLTCRIIDKKNTTSDKSKALGLHIRTLDVLEDCGLIDQFIHEGHCVEGLIIKAQNQILIDALWGTLKTTEKHFLLDLPQSQTETLLYQNLQQQGVQVEWNTELTKVSQNQQEVSATLKKSGNKIELLNINWLIACDGGHSTVREQVGAEFKGSTYKQGWWLADVRLDWNLPENKIYIYTTPQGLLACFPFGNMHYRLIMTAPQELTTDPSLEQITQAFNARSSNPSHINDPSWINQFFIHHRLIDRYKYDRIFFAGDSAHVHSPLGGQGLNTGIQDIYNLVWKLALVEKNKAKTELLDSYHAERYLVGKEVIKDTDLMTRVMLIKNPILKALRNRMMRLMSSFSHIKSKILNKVSELSISYKKSPIVHQSGCGIRNVQAGEFLPIFYLSGQKSNQQISSRVITQGTLHHLFIFAGLKSNQTANALKTANTLANRYATTIKVHLVLTQKSELVSEKITIWLDENQTVHHHFGFKKSSLILVRPDKYIGIIQKPINEHELHKHLYLL